MFLGVRQEALRRTIDSYTKLFLELDRSATRQLGAFTMAMPDGLFIANEIDDHSADLLSESELLAAALLGAVNYLAGRQAHLRKGRR